MSMSSVKQTLRATADRRQRHELPPAAGQAPLGPTQALLLGAARALPNPMCVGVSTRLAHFVFQQQDAAKKDGGTAKALNPKTAEFQQCCDCCHPNSPHKCHLKCDKVCRFMFCVSFREKKKGGTGQDKKNGIFFEKASHDKAMKSFCSVDPDGGETEDFAPPDPKKPIGVDTFQQCKAVFRRMHVTLAPRCQIWRRCPQKTLSEWATGAPQSLTSLTARKSP